jgi:hypothetical protein
MLCVGDVSPFILDDGRPVVFDPDPAGALSRSCARRLRRCTSPLAHCKLVTGRFHVREPEHHLEVVPATGFVGLREPRYVKGAAGWCRF